MSDKEDRGGTVYVFETNWPRWGFDMHPLTGVVYNISTPIGWHLESDIAGARLVNMFGRKLSAFDVYQLAKGREDGFFIRSESHRD